MRRRAGPRRQGKIQQGVVGVIAYRTDACEQSCCACAFEDAELWLLPLDEPVTSEAEALAAVAGGSSSGMTLKVSGAYEQALDVGSYLLCYRSKCAALDVQAGEVFTVNLQLRYGPPSVIVFAPNDGHASDDLVFETNKE